MRINAQEYATERQMRDYIVQCESDFESQLNAAAERIISSPGVRTVTLSGPSSSGKTTTAKKLIRSFEAAGRRAHVVSIDDFYKNRADAAMKLSADGELKPDFETVASIDTDAFSDFAARVNSLGSKETLSVPVYDFNTGERSGVRELDVRCGDIIIFEGIQAIYPEIVSELSAEGNVSVHISVCESLDVGGHIFTPDRIRLMRRLVRDYNYRAATPELTFYLWDEVRDNEINNIEPYTGGCDVLINSLLPYEVGVIAPYLCRVLGEVGAESRYRNIARDITESVADVKPIPIEYVPQGSVFCEFLH